MQWRQLLAVACILVILAIVGSSALVLLRLRTAALDDVSSNLARQSVALAAQANLSLQSVEIVVASTVGQFPLDTIEEQDQLRNRLGGRDVHLTLAEKIVALPQIEVVALIDLAGNVVNASRSWPIQALNVGDRDHLVALRDPLTREPFMSQPFQNRATGAWTIGVARRLNGANGKLLGFVNGSINLGFFENHWRSVMSAGDADALRSHSIASMARYWRAFRRHLTSDAGVRIASGTTCATGARSRHG